MREMDLRIRIDQRAQQAYQEHPVLKYRTWASVSTDMRLLAAVEIIQELSDRIDTLEGRDVT